LDRLPPLRLLVTFDAVTRLGSMRAAAARLNVTQPAVTQAIRALEEHAGAQLLDRGTRPARLTEAGRRLARATRDGLDLIGAALEEIGAEAEAEQPRLTVACTLGMATHWLMPRLPDFYATHPEIAVNVQAPPTDRPEISGGIDVVLRYGTGGWRDGETLRLFDERNCPVGAPSLVHRLMAEDVPLARAPLIHVRAGEARDWASWPEYFARRGLGRAPASRQVFDNYVQAVQAALDGRGLVLGWRSITDGLLEDGSLAAWPDAGSDPGTGYYATLSPRGSNRPAAQAFLDWLKGAARTFAER
jgi:DNA-binding transcriptional LysR family regulator